MQMKGNPRDDEREEKKKPTTNLSIDAYQIGARV